MRKIIVGLVGIGLMLGTNLRSEAADPAPASPPLAIVSVSVAQADHAALSKIRYDVIMSELDVGGDLLVVANLEGLIKQGVEAVTQPMMVLGKNDPNAQSTLNCIAKVPAFLDKNGFYALQGFGMSVVPRSEGLNSIKCFVAREPAAAGLPLWRAMVGFNPKVLECSDFLPADTEMARTGTAEWRSLWKLVRSGIVEIGSPATAASIDAQLASLSTNMGVNLDKLFNSFSGECFFSVQLSETETMNFSAPAGEGPAKMPQPSLLIGIAVTDNTLVSSLEAALAKAGMAPMANEGELAGIKTLNLPIPIPLPLQPSYAVYNNFFLLGSTPAVVAAGIKAFKTKNGLTSTAQFKKAFEGLPTQNNGLSYVSARFMNTLTEVQKTYMNPKAAGKAGMFGVMEQLLSRQQNMQSASVLINKKNGVLSIGNSSAGGKEMIASMMMAPAGMLAAVAIPSFMKAKTQSTQNSCINNLRQIEAAKEQWALAEKKATGDTVVESEIVQYIKGNKLPVCPQGGTYTLNAVGTDCECNIPGHQLSN